MSVPAFAISRIPAALHRLAALTPLDAPCEAALDSAFRQSQRIPARREIVREGSEIKGARLIVSGWAARVRMLPDGQRQLLSFLLPGDLIGLCHHARPLSVSSVVALTDLAIAPAPLAEALPGLAEAYAISRALEEAYLLAHITRLGRFSAQDRLLDLLLELNERLALAGLAAQGRFELPVTQETVADALGLTPVHVNRTVQLSRRSGDLIWGGRMVALTDPAMLARRIGRTPARVSAP